MGCLVSSSEGVNQAQLDLLVKLLEVLPRTIRHSFGHLGKAFHEDVRTNGTLWYYHTLAGEPRPNRFWNAFGLLDGPDPGNIVVEINFPFSGRDQTIAGAVAHDETRGLLLLHRGKVGGGREGIGQRRFLDWFKRKFPVRWLPFDDIDGQRTDFIVVAELSSPTFEADLTKFVEAVAQFKQR